MKTTAVLLLALLLGTGACTTRAESPQPISSARSTPRVAPALTLERFLSAVNASDLQTMADLFGTAEGSIRRRDPASEVEQRMFAIATVLRHQDYRLVGERIVPGRLGRAVQLTVRLQLDNKHADVPFTMVQTGPDQWLVERVDLDPVISR